VKIAQGIRPCGAFIFHILVKFEYKFQFLESYTLVVALMGVKFGTEEEGMEGDLRSPSMPNFTPIGATCRPCGVKTLKIGLSKLNTGGLRCVQCCR